VLSAEHALIQEDLAAYALDGLDPQSTARIEQHLRECAHCREIVLDYEAVKDLLPFGLPLAQPAPGGRSALLRQLKVGKSNRRWWSSRPAQRRWPWSAVRPRAGALALVVGLILILGAGIGVWWQQPSENSASTIQQLRARPDVQVVNLVGSSNAPAAGGQLLFTQDLSRAAVTVSGLPSLPANRTYQVWFDRPDQSWVSGGTFQVDAHGTGDVLLHFPSALATYRGCWITEEPRAGSPTPTGPLVLSTVAH
jgi:anti-sigma-K factor RskA